MTVSIRAIAALAGLLLMAANSSVSAASESKGLRAFDLRCEYAVAPLGIDSLHPRLSWKLDSEQRGDLQTAYRIRVSSTERSKADLWDSGKVEGGAQIGIRYAGRPLESGERAWWSVEVWDSHGRSSGESPRSHWEMGLLAPADWQAAWIGSGWPPPAREEDFYGDRPAPCFRREFEVRKPIRRARAYVTGLGYYEMKLNGRRVGDHVLDPAWTDYDKRVFYSTYDITGLLRTGRNAAGLLLGNGWYNALPLRIFGRNLRQILPTGEPRVLLRMVIEYRDGTTDTVVTDDQWRVAESAIRNNSLYLGEVCDARKELGAWDRPGYDDHAWKPAVKVDAPKGALMAQPLPPIRRGREIHAVKVTESNPGVWIVDMGENFAGVAGFRFDGPAGTVVHMRYAEVLNPDGTLNPLTSVAGQVKWGNGGPGAPQVAVQSDTYTCRGGGETWTPRFTWHGFRYIEITGLPSAPPLASVTGHALHSDVESVGEFACSNDLFNRIQEATRRTILSNIFSVESDCPHRERLGYGGDIVAVSEAVMYNFDMSRFYAKAVDDLADAARPNGGMTETAPYVGIADEGLGDGSGPVGWGTAFPLLQWQLHQYYGNDEPLERYYEMTKRWIDLLEKKAVNGILDNGISDHESLAPKPVPLTGTAFYYLNVELAARIARHLGRTEQAARIEKLADSIRIAFNDHFLDPATGRYLTGTQACQSFALYMNLAGPHQAAALDLLVKDVEAHGGHLTTGIFGTKYMLDALTDNGRADIAFNLVNQRTFPGWGWMLENGATTLWEHWEKEEKIYSHNHPMFGSVSEWFYKCLAGIRMSPLLSDKSPILISPNIVGDLKWVRASCNSVRGKIAVKWKHDGDHLTLDVTIPTGVTALIDVPAKDPATVREGTREAERAEGLTRAPSNPGRVRYRVGGGHYHFTSEL
jgi:alpha-L-rhamnosidase